MNTRVATPSGVFTSSTSALPSGACAVPIHRNGVSLVSNSATYPSPQLNPAQAGFLGDYSSIAASTKRGSNTVYACWSDTRNSSVEGPDEDVFMAAVTIK